MKLEAFQYQELETEQFLLKSRVDSCMITPPVKAWMDRVRATKCVYTVDYLTSDTELEVILDPDQYFALKGQLVNPALKIPKDVRSDIARMLNRKDCIIRIQM